jgi:hypothetical protein
LISSEVVEQRLNIKTMDWRITVVALKNKFSILRFGLKREIAGDRWAAMCLRDDVIWLEGGTVESLRDRKTEKGTQLASGLFSS